MEEEMQSVISVDERNMVEENVVFEYSDSNSINPSMPSNKCTKHGWSKFKGLVPQPNGHWGAQIYINYQRIWLGTFKSETEAAMAYDSAALKLRTKDSALNFELTSLSVKELTFQGFYTNEEVINMIRHGTYKFNFDCFLRTCAQQEDGGMSHSLGSLGGDEGTMCKKLFHKELTPSDVSKLNRLVIPKKFAVKNFPNISGNAYYNGNLSDIQLIFYDRDMRVWKFRYCYWTSSESYVFTRGWNQFVKDKQLKAGEIVTFYECTPSKKTNEEASNNFWVIDVGDDLSYDMDFQVHLRHGKFNYDKVEEEFAGDEVNQPVRNGDGKMFKLFGVWIM
ncbi:AP2/ERF and B3 domain-containing transcription factor At1g50680-like [Carica papaya]|uniref:AP2/ERF and B3 domain-containing transcription factor At1g50680-like n=1 Tax=Carica papaya TaxID=3649 RepID=UPI000B8CCAFF|nr:AP2/ERF and B3 domain-containing transcription factor At1g50680-like [Carica papaya]XP_021899218.1 AP2/ERF and B3 domain-containing transcription factor At1g50680-like [Carica papaya]XP_021899219.1 AP2/ERF and B3 domain-containing transcription factor At1g50680-like [Carica papaya]XP_021899220.1 AP2/ERF and B3 domain-containing transcription factor At1g50680-like [Carica papaya]XP_021899221.1 AP2/ERF and B3 domain-containing transcription factor At1g50680-like [Carica papaya]XP_021899222.1 